MTSTLAEPPEGVQRPRVEHVPARVTSAGEEALAFCSSFGLILDPWQRHVLTESLGERADGRWSAFEVAVLVPRQNGKGALLEARELAGLFLFGEQLILHSAHEFKTAQEAFRRVLFHVENTDYLRKRVRKVRTSHGEEGIELTSGQIHRLRSRLLRGHGDPGRGVQPRLRRHGRPAAHVERPTEPADLVHLQRGDGDLRSAAPGPPARPERRAGGPAGLFRVVRPA
jgi:hypothetical protein